MYYFASDTHLGMKSEAGNHDREKRFVQWLDTVGCDAKAIFLLGDIFDFWYEYRRVVPKGFTRLLGKLSELTDRGIEIHFFTGNHDMWMNGYLSSECGVQVHTQPQIMQIGESTMLLAHGDNIGVRNHAVRFINTLFRSGAVRWLFSHLVHPDAALRFGRWWSASSRKSKRISHEFRGLNEPLAVFARQQLAARHIDYFVFGHTHCSADLALEGGSRALFLGEWIHYPVYAAFDPDSNTMLLLPLNE